MAIYKVTREGDTLGVFTKEGLQKALDEGRLSESDKAWTEGMAAEQSLKELGYAADPARVAGGPTEPRAFRRALVILGVESTLCSIAACWDSPANGWKFSVVLLLTTVFFIVALKGRKAWAHFILTVFLGLMLLPCLFFLASLHRTPAPLPLKLLLETLCAGEVALFWVFNRREVRLWCNRRVS